MTSSNDNKHLMGGGIVEERISSNKTVMGGAMDTSLTSNTHSYEVSKKSGMGVRMETTMTSNKTVMGGYMDVTLDNGPDKTVLGGGMVVASAREKPAVDVYGNKTVLGGCGMDMTIA